jgi:hypothetical protein
MVFACRNGRQNRQTIPNHGENARIYIRRGYGDFAFQPLVKMLG